MLWNFRIVKILKFSKGNFRKILRKIVKCLKFSKPVLDYNFCKSFNNKCWICLACKTLYFFIAINQLLEQNSIKLCNKLKMFHVTQPQNYIFKQDWFKCRNYMLYKSYSQTNVVNLMLLHSKTTKKSIFVGGRCVCV